LDGAGLRARTEEQVTDEVVRLMFGTGEGHGHDAETLLGRGRRRRRAGTVDRERPPLLSVRDLRTEAQLGECGLAGLGFDLWPGEVLGIAGVDGNGQKHLAEVLSGQRRLAAGTIRLG